MSQRLPELIEPDRMAETGRSLKGAISLGKMKRLMPLLYGIDGDEKATAGTVDVSLEFGIDESGQANITGTVETSIQLQCQRCMQAMNLHVAENISLAVVHTSQQARGIASYYEPLLVDDEMVSLPELVEDEILLALPAIPMHEPDQCQAITPDVAGYINVITDEGPQKNREDVQAGTEKRNPFAILEQLRKKD